MDQADFSKNAEALRRLPASLRDEHEGEIAVIQDGEIVGYWPTFRAALNAVPAARDGRCSVQTVRKEPALVGCF